MGWYYGESSKAAVVEDLTKEQDLVKIGRAHSHAGKLVLDKSTYT